MPGFRPYSEPCETFHDIRTHRDNRVVILTGTEAEFSGLRHSQNPALPDPAATDCSNQIHEKTGLADAASRNRRAG